MYAVRSLSYYLENITVSNIHTVSAHFTPVAHRLNMRETIPLLETSESGIAQYAAVTEDQVVGDHSLALATYSNI